MRPIMTIGMEEPMRGEEAGARLRAFVREIQNLDGQVEAINSRKRDLYAEAKSLGFHVKSLKAAARAPSIAEANNDLAILREYLDVLCGSKEACRLLHDEKDFGALLWGSDDSWPATYSDPRYPLSDTPA